MLTSPWKGAFLSHGAFQSKKKKKNLSSQRLSPVSKQNHCAGLPAFFPQGPICVIPQASLRPGMEEAAPLQTSLPVLDRLDPMHLCLGPLPASVGGCPEERIQLQTPALAAPCTSSHLKSQVPSINGTRTDRPQNQIKRAR